MIPSPYLLYLGDATDALSVKTARGIAQWRPDLAMGEISDAGGSISVGLARLSLAEAAARGAQTLVIGFANAGGRMSSATVELVQAALRAGLHIASGLHQCLGDNDAIRQAAQESGRKLFDVRVPPSPIPVGSGAPRPGKRLLTVGTDCSVGKMYTALALERELTKRGVAASFKATGQTGIFIASGGVPVDALVADFISGGVEQLTPGRDDEGWDLIEGQGSLFHPSYAGVSLGLLHGAQAHALVLCHQAGRERIRKLENYAVPRLTECLARNLEAARLTNPAAQAVGVSVNTSGMDLQAALAACRTIEDDLGLPCEDPLSMGVERIADRVLACAS